MSGSQQRLWFIDKLEPGNPAYNLPGVLVLRGELDTERLLASLNQIIQRHEALRLRFFEDEHGPKQQAVEQLQLVVDQVDLSHTDNPKKHAQELEYHEARKPFDLCEAPLVRSTLIQLAPDHHHLLITMHHLITDGWSMGVLIDELSHLYNTSKPDLPELPIQFTDYALWQQQQHHEEDATWWQQQLQGAPTVLNLPTDYPRPKIMTHRGANHRFIIGPEIAEPLAAFAKMQASQP